jgi:tRNA dimethylallyltransferase
MTIGTAKPSTEELQAVKHYFIDEFPVTTALTAADYEELALKYLDDIFSTRPAAVVCGGTGLYIKALCEGLDQMPQVDPTITKAVDEAYKQNGIPWLQQAMEQEDPEFFKVGETQNPARMLRALSFIRTTGKSIVHYRTNTRKERPFRTIKVGLELPREVLYARINSRVDKMMQEGLLQEVQSLFPLRQLKNLQTVGYAELFEHLEGKCGLDEAVEKIKQHTRNYAKRQLTWFKKDPEFIWFRADDPGLVDKILASH